MSGGQCVFVFVFFQFNSRFRFVFEVRSDLADPLLDAWPLPDNV